MDEWISVLFIPLIHDTEVIFIFHAHFWRHNIFKTGSDDTMNMFLLVF